MFEHDLCLIARKLEVYHNRFENEGSLKALAQEVRQLADGISSRMPHVDVTPPPLPRSLGSPPPLRQTAEFLR